MVTIVLTDDTGGRQLPQPRIVVAAYRNQVSRIRRESAVPDPALMVLEHSLTRQWLSLGDEVRDDAKRVRVRGLRSCRQGRAASGFLSKARRRATIYAAVDLRRRGVGGVGSGGFWHRLEVLFIHIDLPDTHSVISRARCKEFDVW